MTKTIFITGASTGIGKATVEYFLAHNWNVAATMRSPENHEAFKNRPGVKLYKLDVTDSESISKAIKEAISDFGRIDAVLNNAGYGAVGLFEAAKPEQIKRQYDTNVFGAMNVIQQILPHFRQNRSGIIINISSIGGKVTFPLYSLYHGSKWAIEGFSESLHYELLPLGIRVKIIEPGAIKTDFNSRSQDYINDEGLSEYQQYITTTMRNMMNSSKGASDPEVVAKTIYKATNDGTNRLRYSTGKHAGWLLPLRKLLPEKWFIGIVRNTLEKGLKK